MVVFSNMAITREAAVTCNSAPSTVLHRIKAHASTTANRPKRRTVSSRKAIKRSPSLAKRYLPAPRTGAGVERAGVAAGLASMTPHSSRRCWLEGIAPPQRLQCFECELTWLWQCGHSILRRPSRQLVKHTPAAHGPCSTEGQRSNGHCPVGNNGGGGNAGL